MTLRNAKPLRFSPAGLSDSLAEEDAFPGACAVLTNLIPDPSTKNVWTPRPASILATNFTGFTTPTGVSVFKVVGTLVYGMVSSAHFAGKDEPFVYNLATSSFVTVTGQTSGNCPTTQATTGEWTPPTIDVMGTFVVVTHPGFDGVTNFIGWFDATNPAAPVWHAGNFSLVTPLLTVMILVGGSGYTNGTYTDVAITSNPGAGALGTVVVSGGAVTSITVTDGGLAYQFGATVYLNNTVIGIGGSGFVGIVGSVVGSGIIGLSLIGGGSGYTNGAYTNVAISSTNGTGSGATANFIVSGGAVTSVVPDVPGGGYLLGSLVTVTGHSVLTFSGLVGGSGYTPGSFVNVPLTGGLGTGATADITVNGSGVVTACTIDQGGANYNVSDVLSAGGGGVASTTSQVGTNVSAYLADGTYLLSGSSTPAWLTGYRQSGGNAGTGAVITIVVSGGIVTSNVINAPGAGYKAQVGQTLGDQISVNLAYGGGVIGFLDFNVLTVVGSGPLATGTGFAVTVASVSAYPIGAGAGFSAQVLQVQNPGGYINFTTIPSWVRQFNGRSWFGINPPTGQPSVIFSDVYALNCTNGNQALQFGDNNILTAAAPLPLSNLLGGIIQSLIIFQQFTGIIQITGDQTTNNLSVNNVPGGSGTGSPRSVVTHPQGLLYLDHDGYRMVTMDGTCTDPIGVSGAGVSVPLMNPVYLTRVNAACNGSVLRVSLQNAAVAGTPWQEYWFDLTRKNWSGPHTFPSIMIDGYGAGFVVAPQVAPANLFTSAIQPEGVTSFVENGVSLTWAFQTVVLMDNQQMAESEIAEMQIKITPAGLTSVAVTIIDQVGATIATMTYTFGAITGLAARSIAFSAPVVYNRVAIKVTGSSALGFQIGDIYAKVRALGYLQPVA